MPDLNTFSWPAQRYQNSFWSNFISEVRWYFMLFRKYNMLGSYLDNSRLLCLRTLFLSCIIYATEYNLT